MKFISATLKILNSNRIIFLVSVFLIILVVSQYSKGRDLINDGMMSRQNDDKDESGSYFPSDVPSHESSDSSSSKDFLPANPLGENGDFGSALGYSTSSMGIQGGPSKESLQDPSSLLPNNESNNEWARLNPSGQGSLNNVNLLKAGHHIGIDSVGQSMRNSNLQIRSEPPNPIANVGPWMNTTIEPDLQRRPLEIG